MHYLIFFTLLFTSVSAQVSSEDCADLLISSAYPNSAFNPCANPIIISKDSAHSTYFPTFLKTQSTKELSIDAQFSVTSVCSGSRMYAFSLTIQPSTVQKIAYLHFSDTFASYGAYEAGANDPSDTSARLFSQMLGADVDSSYTYEFFLTFSLSDNLIRGFLHAEDKIYSGEATANYDPTWNFDDSTIFYFCTTSLPISQVAICNILSFTVWYTFHNNDYRQYSAGFQPTLIGHYILNELSGDTVYDRVTGSSVTGSFIPDYAPPQWLKNEAGVEFTAQDQYIELLPFTIPGYRSPFYSFTITFSFWIKYSAGNEGYIFMFFREDFPTQEFLNLYINNDGKMRPCIGDSDGTFSDSPISFSTWTLITATFEIYPDWESSYVTIYAGETRILSFSPMATLNLELDISVNKLHIGGHHSYATFLGSISNFQIFHSGSALISNTDSCSSLNSICELALGFLDYAQCLTYPSDLCHESCLTCAGLTATSCLSCKSGYNFQNQQCVKIPKTQTPSQPQTTTPSATADAISGSQTASQAVTQIANALTAGSPSGISAAVAGKIFSNVKYLNISYSEKLEEALTSWGSSFISLGLTPNMPNSVQKRIPQGSVPYVFEKHDVPSSFLLNFWESFGVLLFVSMIYLVVRFLEWITIKIQPKTKYLSYIVVLSFRTSCQNFLLAQFYSVYGDILLFSILEFRSPNFTNGWSRFSFASCLIFLFIMVILLSVHLMVLWKYQKTKRLVAETPEKNELLSQFVNEQKGNQVLFNEYKDYSFIRQSFLLLLTARDLLFSLLLATMFEHPLMEITFILSLNIAMVVYLILRPPFKSVFDAAQQLFYEVVALAVNVSVLIMAIMDEIGSTGTELRGSIGKFIIIVNFVFNFGSLAFMLVKVFESIRNIYQIYKEKRNRKKNLVKIKSLQRVNDINVSDANQSEAKNMNKNETIINQDDGRVSHRTLNDDSMNTSNIQLVSNMSSKQVSRKMFKVHQSKSTHSIFPQNQEIIKQVLNSSEFIVHSENLNLPLE